MEPNKRPKFFDQFDEPAKSDYDRLLDNVRAQMRYAIAKHPRLKKSAASEAGEFSFLSGFRPLVRYAINKHPGIGAKLIDIINEEEPNESK
jgi:hypothetical protein